MTQDKVVSLLVEMMGVTIKVALPMLLAGLIVGLAVSVFQAVTQIQEQTLSFIPKIVALVAVILIAGPWMLSSVVDWTHDLWGGIAQTVDFKPVGGGSDGP
jgi:flagellar biosynthesis protein FliQ